MTSDSMLKGIIEGLIAGFVAGIVIYTLQVIWQIKKDYLILMDKVDKLENRIEALEKKG